MLALETAKILSNKHLKGDFFVMEFYAPEIATKAKPGQFLNIKVSEDTDPLLRRPISIYDANSKNGKIKILYFKKGKGTSILSTKKEGESLSITGPHGNGFRVNPDSKTLLLVGGGFGIAPLSFLAKENRNKKIFTVIGARNKELLLGEKEFKQSVTVCTDDGSCGLQGNAVDGIKAVLSKRIEIDQIIAVGPLPMMKSVAELAKEKGIDCQVSLEERMGCGIGACLGCACKTKEGYKTVCATGPVFNSEEVF